ncbi:MAG: enoyl-CoA hydratase/isomerase family protein [Acidobacteria bacterium]|nr:enoyl-CoA hydratase/isomerase family protein [Acidobacteriota bacterium]
MTTPAHIEVERDGTVARVWLNRPGVNVLDIPTLEELNAALDALPAPPHVSFVVFAGRGDRAFSAGVDVLDHTPDRVGQLLHTFHRVFRKLWQSDWVTVAAVHGFCLGGGMELATFCDFVIATHTARFSQPEIKLGCFPPVAAILLPLVVGRQRTLELILTARTLTAEEAQGLGLVTEVVAEGELDRAVVKLIHQLSAHSAAVVPLARRAVLRASGLDFDRALDEMEKLYLDTLMKTEDAAEGIRAFLERRQPVWVGR